MWTPLSRRIPGTDLPGSIIGEVALEPLFPFFWEHGSSTEAEQRQTMPGFSHADKEELEIWLPSGARNPPAAAFRGRDPRVCQRMDWFQLPSPVEPTNLGPLRIQRRDPWPTLTILERRALKSDDVPEGRKLRCLDVEHVKEAVSQRWTTAPPFLLERPKSNATISRASSSTHCSFDRKCAFFPSPTAPERHASRHEISPPPRVQALG